MLPPECRRARNARDQHAGDFTTTTQTFVCGMDYSTDLPKELVSSIEVDVHDGSPSLEASVKSCYTRHDHAGGRCGVFASSGRVFVGHARLRPPTSIWSSGGGSGHCGYFVVSIPGATNSQDTSFFSGHVVSGVGGVDEIETRVVPLAA